MCKKNVKISQKEHIRLNLENKYGKNICQYTPYTSFRFATSEIAKSALSDNQTGNVLLLRFVHNYAGFMQKICI